MDLFPRRRLDPVPVRYGTAAQVATATTSRGVRCVTTLVGSRGRARRSVPRSRSVHARTAQTVVGFVGHPPVCYVPSLEIIYD